MDLDYCGPLHCNGREGAVVVLEGTAGIPNERGYSLRQYLHGRGGHPRNRQSDREAERAPDSLSHRACFSQLFKSFHKHHRFLSEQPFLLSANYDGTMAHLQAAYSCGCKAGRAGNLLTETKCRIAL